ncbi:TetR/AcrR family transcriptional regulator [Ammonicoccus fulvus]|uniref:TetR/AcrR family transcriptional regulator n=1 Tax=Ammonicoccus fulvus TaxID=3138240 RepID=A0ABZ3FMF6_9ACTN
MPTKQDWIEAGMRALRADGGDGVRIDRIARDLGVTKGSFHHHFKGAAGLRAALLAEHERRQESLVAAIREAVATLDGEQAIALLSSLVAELPDDRLERVVRAWAATNDDAAVTAERIDRARVDALEAIWSRAVPVEHARTAALLPFLVLTGASATGIVDRAELEAVFRLLAELAPHSQRILAGT